MTRSQRSTTTGRMPPDAAERAFPDDRLDGTTTVVTEKTSAHPASGDVVSTGENRSDVGAMGTAKRRHFAGTTNRHGLHDDEPSSVDKRTVVTAPHTDGQFDDGLDVYPEGSARSTRSGHDTFRDDRHEARGDRDPRGVGGGIDTFPETSRTVRPVSTTSSVTGSTGRNWSDEPIITRAGETPASVRAAAAPPATAQTTASRTMTADRTATAGPGTLPGGRKGRRGAGALVSEVASDMSMLVRQEIDLAKAEVRQSAVRAGKGAGMFGGAAGAGVFAVLFLLLAAMFGLSEVMALGWAALIVAALLIVSAAVFALLGRANVKKAHAKPEQTVETLKEDMQWAHGLRK
ncbi:MULTISPECIES: phage holin family protein [unclassified Frankia]|uniref:phage holin family protein n=1 Tax=unclassified Frankia TaxID=2632575 RepID=UPI0027DE7001|nr:MULTISPECIES: phage holin family protein [unclassified Frankia]